MRGVRELGALVASCAVAACTGPSPRPTAPPPPRASVERVGDAPTLAELRVLVARQGEHELDDSAAARGCVPGEKLRDYLDRIVRAGAAVDDGDGHDLYGGCGIWPAHPLPTDPQRDDAYWFCVIGGHTWTKAADPDRPGTTAWHHQLRLRVRVDDERIDLPTLSCVDAGSAAENTPGPDREIEPRPPAARGRSRT